MNVKKHIEPGDMKELLFGDPDQQQSDYVANHIDQCETCQLALDSMAATPDLWEKAAHLKTESPIFDTLAFTNGVPQDGIAKPGAAESWDYPVDSLLDNPSHPEMMGRIGQYDVEREVGRGGMGVVFKAYDSDLNRPVAIKVLAPHLSVHGAAKKRFAREARAAAAVLHPNVIAIHGVSSTEKTPYIVMRYVSGPSLNHLVEQQGPLDEKDVVRIAMQIASGLAAAHSQGLVHRDIKPANILIEASVSRVLITDFGLARAENDASMTQTGWLAGTPNFMSPEQAHGRQIDGRSDIFSLGSVMYFMATGRLPFRAETPMAVLNRICHETPTPLRQVNSDVSRTLAEIVDQCLAKNPADRFQSAASLHETLEKFLAYLHQPDIARRPVIRRPRQNKVSVIRLATLFSLLLVPLLALGYNTAWFGWKAADGKPVNSGLDPSPATTHAPLPAAPGIAGSGALQNDPATTPGSRALTPPELIQQYQALVSEDQGVIQNFGIQLHHLEQQLDEMQSRLDLPADIDIPR